MFFNVYLGVYQVKQEDALVEYGCFRGIQVLRLTVENCSSVKPDSIPIYSLEGKYYPSAEPVDVTFTRGFFGNYSRIQHFVLVYALFFQKVM